MDKNNIKTDNTSNLIKKYNKHINVFKYEDEFNLAIDFIKKHKCDIIGKELNEIELKEVI